MANGPNIIQMLLVIQVSKCVSKYKFVNAHSGQLIPNLRRKRKVNSENKKEKRNVAGYRARQLYKNISMLFLFPVKDGKLSTGINAAFNAPCYG